MEIRRLSINDYEEIVRLWTKASLPFKPKGRDSREAVAAEIASNPDFFFGAFENNRLIGVVVLSSDLRKGWINRLAVDPSFRRCSVAERLINASEEILRDHGIKLFCALIDEGNGASMSLFKKCGYAEHRDIVYFSKRDSDDI